MFTKNAVIDVEGQKIHVDEIKTRKLFFSLLRMKNDFNIYFFFRSYAFHFLSRQRFMLDAKIVAWRPKRLHERSYL